MPHLLIQGNALTLPLASNSIHTCVTSIPYWGLRDYGLPPQAWGGAPDCEHSWGALERGRRKDLLPADQSASTSRMGVDDRQGVGPPSGGQFCQRCGAWLGCLGLEPTVDLFIEHIVMVFREVKRVLHPSGTVWLNVADTYATASNGRPAKEIEKDDRTFCDKPFNTVGGVLKEKDLCLVPDRLRIALQADGWYVRSNIIWSKRNPMPSSVKDRPAPSHEYVILLSKRDRYFYDHVAVREKTGREASAAEYTSAIGSNKGADSDRLGAGYRKRSRAVTHPSGRNLRTVWTLSTQALRGKRFGVDVEHFAAYPEKLVEPCILAGTSAYGCCVKCKAPWERVVGRPERESDGEYNGKDGTADPQFSARRMLLNLKAARKATGSHDNPFPTPETLGWRPTCRCPRPERLEVEPCRVLDMFCGSGTTGVVALRHGRDFVGVDLSADYLQLAQARIQHSLTAKPKKPRTPRPPRPEQPALFE